MISMIWTLFAFIVAIIILVTVHEFGHFITAKKLGVRVLCFSIGFGSSIVRWFDREGTEYRIAWIPLGGYVKMLDSNESEEPIAKQDLPYAFDQQSVYKRMLIVLAGPIFNFMLAFLCFCLMYLIGVKSILPIVGQVKPNSIAAHASIKANQQILKVDNRQTHNWRTVQLSIMRHAGSKKPLELTLQDRKDKSIYDVTLSLKHWRIDARRPEPLSSIGITPFLPPLPPIVGSVVPGSAAAKYGIEEGDEIISVNNKPVTNWIDFAKAIRDNPGKKLRCQIERDDEQVSITVVPDGRVDAEGVNRGFIGVQSLPLEIPDELIYTERHNLLDASYKALQKTWYLSKLSLIFIGKLIVGHVSLASVSGPLGIAQGAGQSASFGIIAYLGFLALISISLAVINLLPIPILDGGHFLNYLIELLRGKALSQQTQERNMKLGFLVIASLMMVALYNDVARLMS